MKRILILAACIALLAFVLLAGTYIQGDEEVPKSQASATVHGRVETESKPHPLPSVSAEAPKDRLGSIVTQADSGIRSAMFREWADAIGTDKMGALLEELNETLTPEETRTEVRRALLASWCDRDLAGLGEWFGGRYAADELHQEARDRLLAMLFKGNPVDSFSWMMNALPVSAREELYQPFLHHWAKIDPAAASANLLELTKTDAANTRWRDLLGETVRQWSEQNLSSAVNWTKALPSSPAKFRALEELSHRWAKIDPQAAANYATTQNDPATLETVAGTWAASDPERAHAWAFELPAGEGRNRAVTAATAIWAAQAPAAAAEYVERLPEGEARNQARIVVAARWAESEGLKAAKWTQLLPENSVREQAAARVAMAWAIRDATAVGKWLQNLPKSRSRDAAVLAYCSVVEASEPAAAFTSAEWISDAPLRQQRQEKSASLWLEQNPAAARQGIAKSTLSEDLKKQLLLRSY